MKKRFLALILCLCMVISMLPCTALAADETTYEDVKTGDWFYEAVQYVTENNLMVGTGANQFSPNATLTRAMVVTVLYRLDGSPEVTEQSTFEDVPADAWFANGVAWAAANGIASGYSAAQFGPNDSVTREQMAAFLYRYAAYKGYDVSAAADLSSYTDAAQISAYAETALSWANATGLMVGKSETTLDPAGKATRAEAAAILMRFCQNIIPAPVGSYKVTFDLNYNGGTIYQTVTVVSGEAVSKPADPSRKGYTFTGWYLQSPYGNTKYDFNTYVTADLTLYAGWTKDKSAEPETNYTVTFESNGGSAVESQQVVSGACAEQPEDPEREGFAFIGWFSGDGYADLYDFSTPVAGNVTIYAKWYDSSDTTDSDNDGLTDSLEEVFGADPSSDDTDGDGLTDYTELNWLYYNPADVDTNGDGITDDADDCDEDGLTNLEEQNLGTNPAASDSDFDGLSDSEEINDYHTEPMNEDTDGDGVTDGDEVLIGSDPLVAETSFETESTYGTVNEATPVSASAEVVTDAEGAGTLEIDQVTVADNILLGSDIAGYLGSAYSFSTDGTFESATLTFSYDTSLGTIGDDFQPRIYYYNEDTQLLEELENQTVTDGQVSVEVQHFSTYVLLNKVEFDKAWENEIRPPETSETEDTHAGVDVVFVIDSSGSMDYNDSKEIRKAAAKAFVDKLGENDRAAVIDFDWGAYIYQNFTDDHTLLYTAIDRVDSWGGTSLSAGMNAAINLFTGSDYNRTDAYKYIIFLTDGDGGYSASYTTTAAENGIVVYTIGLGSGVVESRLKNIANGTGGKYYFATTASDLPEIYEDISIETVDYTTDSNNDGISDYYTKLLNDGELTCGTSSCELYGCTDMFGEDNDDWDGDGLKNGEEISVAQCGDKVYVIVNSDPLLVDTDGDGYNDDVEVKQNTPPRVYSSTAADDLLELEDNENYIYTGKTAEDFSWESFCDYFSLTLYDGFKIDSFQKEQVKNELMDFVYDYASEDTIDANAESIANLEQREGALEVARGLLSVMKAAKAIVELSDDLEDKESLDDTGKVKKFIDKVKTGEIETVRSNAGSSRKEILEVLNSNSKQPLGTVISDGKSIVSDAASEIKAIKGYFDDLEDGNIAAIPSDFGSIIENTASCFVTIAGVAQSVKEIGNYIKLTDQVDKDLVKAYSKYSKGTAGAVTVLDVGLDFADAGLEVWENYNTYGKIKANRDAYVKVLEVFTYMSQHTSNEWGVRSAADDLRAMVADTTWETYEKQLRAANMKTVAVSTLNIALDIGASKNPYLNALKQTLNGLSIGIKALGFANNGELTLKSIIMTEYSRGCIYNIEKGVIVNSANSYFAVTDTSALVFMTQLAQCRIVGENNVKQRMTKMDAVKILNASPKVASKVLSYIHIDVDWNSSYYMTDDEVDNMYKNIFGRIYSLAKSLHLTLSEELPSYSDFKH